MTTPCINQTATSKRSTLSSELPLSTPYMVQIFPIYACNFKCNYCLHSVEMETRRFVADRKVMDFDLYKKCIDDLKQFPNQLKMLRFAATGEPLLHPKLPEMIAYAKKQEVANSIDVVSNGALLTAELSDRLISAGLDWLRISIQGVSSEKYREICKTEVDIDHLVSQISYFYENKINTKLYIKIIDIDLSEAEKEQFFKLFEPISDRIAIEHLVPATEHIDYSKVSPKEMESTQNGNHVLNAEVCPQPFYMMQINPDGNVVPCCAMETAFISGSCEKNSLVDIWNGKPLRDFRKMQLEKRKSENVICSECKTYKFNMFEEDFLDAAADDLLARLYRDEQ